jgi:hypothetical protein
VGTGPDPTLIGVLYFLVTTLIALAVWVTRAIIRGDLVPKKSVEYAQDIWKQIAEEHKAGEAEWKSQWEAERAIGVNNRENRDILLAVSKTMDRVLSSLPASNNTNVGG